MDAVVAQTDPTGGGVLAIVVTALVAWLFYAATLHLAATFFVGEVPSQRAATAGLAPAVVSILLGEYGRTGATLIDPGVDLALSLVALLLVDGFAISYSYETGLRSTAALTLLHFGFAAVLGFALNNVFGFV
jgi:hypothetical protein